jgi:hypothetical protein
MNQMMNDLQPGNGDVDGILTRFFRAEMPHPWPECEASAQARRTPRISRFRAVGRLALAASVVLFFLGYFTLAGFFPRSTQGPPSQDGPQIGKTASKSTIK